MTGVDETTLEIVRKLKGAALPEDAVLLAFGSRVYGEPKKLSDLDVAVKNASKENLQQFAEYLAVAPTVVRVDASRYEDLPEWLRLIIDEKGVAI